MLSGKGQSLKRIYFLILFIQNSRQEKAIRAAGSQNDGELEGRGLPAGLGMFLGLGVGSAGVFRW